MKRNNITKDTKKLFMTTGIFTGIAFVSVLVYKITQHFPEFITRYYSHNLFNIITMPGKWIAGLFPFSLGEILLILLILFIIISLIYTIVMTIKKSRNYLLRFISLIIITADIALTLFIWGGGLNYNGLTLTEQLNFSQRNYSAQELYHMTLTYIGKANELRSNGAMDETYDFEELCNIAYDAYGNIPEKYSHTLPQGYFTKAKPALFSEWMCYTNITGIYPYLVPEPIINTKIPRVSEASTLCHEMAHQRAIAREDEANYISFLACTYSDNGYFQYSGYYMAVINCLNSLYSVNYELWTDAWQHMSEDMRKDISNSHQFWQQYETKVSEISERVNDAYLQANNIKDGAESYGRLTDLLLADYYSDRD